MTETFINKIKEKNITISLDELMSKHTSFKVGGPVDAFITANSIEEIQFVLKEAKTNCIRVYIIGNGTNLLVKDNGIRGIVLKLNLNKIDINKNDDEIIVTAESGVKLGLLAQKLLQNNISGFEFASGIPGTIGGAVRMNAGAHGGEMKDIVVKTTYLDMNGNIYEIDNNQHEFEYRNSMFSRNEYVILSTVLRLHSGNQDEIKSKMEEYAKYRKEKQPIEYPNAGSTFKRGKDFITAQIIDECGLKGYNIGGAQISPKHAGFIINKENATAKDILELIQYTKETVFKKTGKEIELEVEVIGE